MFSNSSIIYIGENSYSRNLNRGSASISYGNRIDAGSYNVTVIYEGDGYYYAANYTHNETLNVLPTNLCKFCRSQ